MIREICLVQVLGFSSCRFLEVVSFSFSIYKGRIGWYEKQSVSEDRGLEKRLEKGAFTSPN